MSSEPSIYLLGAPVLETPVRALGTILGSPEIGNKWFGVGGRNMQIYIIYINIDYI